VIILDTNVVSELMKPHANQAVLTWLAASRRIDLVTTSITKAEVLDGIARPPDVRRKTALAAEAQRMFRDDLGDRVLPFDDAAANYYTDILETCRRAGRLISIFDAQIAAIALANDAAVATRNVTDFTGCGVEIINPWDAG
jgi:toxin FitB